MQLLVSVMNADEAEAAVRGGADFVDAKDPAAGPLGAVALETLLQIRQALRARRPLTAALGDARDERDVAVAAASFRQAGAMLTKIGFAGVESEARAASLLAAAVGAMPHTGAASLEGVVAVAYADHVSARAPGPEALAELAAHAGAAGVLIDTFDKHGPGLRALVTGEWLARWTARAHAAGLMVAAAGRLGPDDLTWVRDAGVDVAGVRGAACEGGRWSSVSAGKVRLLRAGLKAGPCEGVAWMGRSEGRPLRLPSLY